MKRLFTLSLLGFAAYQASAEYRIDLLTISGGGTSAGGAYRADLTIGEPGNGTFNGGQYTLEGGFWNILDALQIPGTPGLTVALTSVNTVLVCWPSPSGGFALEQNSDLGTSNWSPLLQQPTDDGVTKCISLNLQNGNLFLRLKK
jgi:hypothetical protein